MSNTALETEISLKSKNALKLIFDFGTFLNNIKVKGQGQSSSKLKDLEISGDFSIFNLKYYVE